ncbi:MAG TPA: hypothetical protein PLA12_00230 [Candidatus Hydrogenedens sp.]|nr:hypothetical protein [Candidatus Hydrogenedens sp.]
MNIMMENIITGIVKPVSGLTGKEQKLEEPAVRKNENATSARYEEGELPIGLGVVPIIPTGSIFIPRELVLPKEEKPLEVEVIPSNNQALLPQKVEKKQEEQKSEQAPASEQDVKIETPKVAEKDNHSLDILV